MGTDNTNVWDGVKRIKEVPPHTEPKDCPTYYDRCHCLDECPQPGRGGAHSDDCDSDTPCAFCGFTPDDPEPDPS